MSDAPTPPEPVGDWHEWSAAQMRALHPEPDAQIAAIRERLSRLKAHWHLRTRHTSSSKDLCAGPDDDWYELVRFLYDEDGPYIVWENHEDLQFAVHAPDDMRLLLSALDAARAERDALRSRLALTDAERKAVESVTEWVDMGEHLHDYQVRHLLAIIARITRDGGGR